MYKYRSGCIWSKLAVQLQVQIGDMNGGRSTGHASVGISRVSHWEPPGTGADTRAPLRSEAGSFGREDGRAMDLLGSIHSQAELAPIYRSSGTPVSVHRRGTRAEDEDKKLTLAGVEHSTDRWCRPKDALSSWE